MSAWRRVANASNANESELPNVPSLYSQTDPSAMRDLELVPRVAPHCALITRSQPSHHYQRQVSARPSGVVRTHREQSRVVWQWHLLSPTAKHSGSPIAGEANRLSAGRCWLYFVVRTWLLLVVVDLLLFDDHWSVTNVSGSFTRGRFVPL